jgi:uncharacterized protein (TIGR00369 family)
MTLKEWDPRILDQVRQFMATQIPFNRVLGIEVTDLAEGFCRMEIPYRPELIGDPFRPAIHGGVLSSLIDACGGGAVFTLIVPPDKVSTIDLRVDYLRPGALERIICEAKVSRLGNRVASVDMKIFQPSAESKVVATGKGVYNVKRVKVGADPPAGA